MTNLVKTTLVTTDTVNSNKIYSKKTILFLKHLDELHTTLLSNYLTERLPDISQLERYLTPPNSPEISLTVIQN